MNEILIALVGAALYWVSVKYPWTQPYIEGAFAGVGTLAGVLAYVKKRLGDPKLEDPTWKRWAYGVVGVLDWAAFNSEPIHHKYVRTGIKAPSPRIPPLPMFLLCLGVLMSSSSACAPGLQAASQSIKAIHGVIDQELRADAQQIRENTTAGAERAAALEQLKADYAHVLTGYEALATAFDAYVRQADLALSKGERSVPENVRLALLDAWDSLLREADILHIDIPAVPEVIRAIAGSLKP